MAKKNQGKTRVAFIGDSITRGGGSHRKINATFKYDTIFPLNGSVPSYIGFPQMIWEKLGKNKNKFDFINFGQGCKMAAGPEADAEYSY